MPEPLPPPFPPSPRPMRQWVKDNDFQQSLDKVLPSVRGLGAMGIALVDLSHRSSDGRSEGYIRYAGKNDTAQIFVASLAKLAVMFAAYHLLEKVQQAVWNLQGKKEEVWATVTAAWKPLVSNKVPGLPQDFP